jgi:hypothetical protein
MGVEFEGWWEVAGMSAVFCRLKMDSCIVVHKKEPKEITNCEKSIE